MDNNFEAVKIFKFEKPVIIHEGQVLNAQPTEVINNPIPVNTPVQREEVVLQDDKTQSISSIIDDIASTIKEEQDELVLPDRTAIERPLIEAPIVNNNFVSLPTEVSQAESNTNELSDTEKNVFELTQEIKMELDPEEITKNFLTSSEIGSLKNDTNSIVVEKKEIESIPLDQQFLDKYQDLYGPDEQGLYNLTFNDGNKYITVKDYLESERVLELIPYDSVISYENSSETINGKEFIRNILIPYLMKNGYHTLNDAIDILGARVSKTEEKKSFIKSFFSRH